MDERPDHHHPHPPRTPPPHHIGSYISFVCPTGERAQESVTIDDLPYPHEVRKEVMGPPYSTPQSPKPSLSPSATSEPSLPLQALINTSASTTMAPTPRQDLAIDMVVGDPGIVRDLRATTESRQSHSRLAHRGSGFQPSKAPPYPQSGLATSPTSTLSSSVLRSPPPKVLLKRGLGILVHWRRSPKGSLESLHPSLWARRARLRGSIDHVEGEAGTSACPTWL